MGNVLEHNRSINDCPDAIDLKDIRGSFAANERRPQSRNCRDYGN